MKSEIRKFMEVLAAFTAFVELIVAVMIAFFGNFK